MKKLWNNQKKLVTTGNILIIAWLLYLLLVLTVPCLAKPVHVRILIIAAIAIFFVGVFIANRISDLAGKEEDRKRTTTD
ncbi:hypothetical protein JXA12_02235 [Candidatus Woesearchaeota archaeon]|nr:hypothetical protein [Candidatus Woesearchaeota archaeon]